MVAAYKQIIAFRQAHEAIKTGQLTAYSDPDVVAFEKKSGSDDVLIIVNSRNSVINYTVPAALQNTIWTNGFNNTGLTLTTQLSLQPYQYLVLKK